MYIPAKMKGFTLLELMAVVAIIGVLASIGFPSYIHHAIKARRTAATACLMEAAQYAERYYTTKMSYAGMNVATASAGCARDIRTHYRITGTSDATHYKLTAEPQGQQQARDTQCGRLAVDHAGQREVSGTFSAEPHRCF